MEYFFEIEEEVYAILNQKHRKSENDVMVRLALHEDERTIYNQLKQEGKDESAIFQVLFPEFKSPHKKPRKIEINVDDLNKPQVIKTISMYMETELPSLSRMTLKDLQELLLFISKRDVFFEEDLFH